MDNQNTVLPLRNQDMIRIKALKLYKDGLSQKDIAIELGVSQTTIAKWYKKFLDGGLEAIKYKRNVQTAYMATTL